jgi:release factor glutamine methyltransferase
VSPTTPTASTTVTAALTEARRQGAERLDAERLLGHLLGRERSWLRAHDDAVLAPELLARWQALLARRLAGEPLAYLVGEREFHGLRLQVTPAVLDPRPDTETLVDWAIEHLAAQPAHPAEPARLLDLGTGSGAIALALAAAARWAGPDAALHGARVTAVDLSDAALAVARDNGQRLGLAVEWRAGAWFEPVAGQRFDLVLSNPPYIAEGDPHLAALRHEPTLALTSGPDGLRDLRQIVAQAGAHLRPGGGLLLEHGHDQADAVAALLAAAGFETIDHRSDLAGHRRCTGGRWPGA